VTSIKLESGGEGPSSRVAAMLGPRVRAILLCLSGLAVVGYAVAHWTAGTSRLAVVGFAAAPVEHSEGGSSSADVFRSSIPGESDPAQPVVPRQSPGIAADLVLTGVASGGRAAIAIIADAGGRESAYRIGDQIRAGVTLVEVSRNGAVVARGDKRERLPLTRSVKTENPRPGDSEASSLRVDSPMVAAGSGPWVPGRSALRRRNFAPEVLGQGEMVPDPAGGFQMKKVMPDSLYSRLGLRAGDVLRSVNGAPVDSPEQLMVLYRQLNEGGQGGVEVLREGRSEALHYGGS